MESLRFEQNIGRSGQCVERKTKVVLPGKRSRFKRKSSNPRYRREKGFIDE
jgi:hypothetical protein